MTEDEAKTKRCPFVESMRSRTSATDGYCGLAGLSGAS